VLPIYILSFNGCISHLYNPPFIAKRISGARQRYRIVTKQSETQGKTLPNLTYTNVTLTAWIYGEGIGQPFCFYGNALQLTENLWKQNGGAHG